MANTKLQFSGTDGVGKLYMRMLFRQGWSFFGYIILKSYLCILNVSEKLNHTP